MIRALLLCALATACASQQPQMMSPVRIDPVATAAAMAAAATPVRTLADDPFTRIDHMWLPAPNRYRSADGQPGPAYWQQRADYRIDASLDTTNRTVRGHVAIHYTNNSPDTLRFVWLQVDQNLYAPGSKGSALFTPDSRWGVRGFEGGDALSDLRVDGQPAHGHADDTMMRIDLDRPLAPGGDTANIAMDFAFRVPDHGSDRMGRDGTLYEIAQWYPRMVVYDDIRGWNTDPYLGQGEFYLEYGTFDYAITVPAGYTVAGSGVLQNESEVLSPAERERLAQAMRTEQQVSVITRDEARARVTPGTRTWRFHADRVRDVAWAAAPDFRWDATSWHGVRIQAFYQYPKAGSAWETGAEQTQWTIKTYSQLWYPYPYPSATSVAGPVGGMEYPMFVMVHYGSGQASSTFGTIDHEHGHEWFPMIVGSNERRYAWQDEGFNTYQNAFSNERRYPGTSAFAGYMQSWRQAVDQRVDVPLLTPPDRIDARALAAIGYRKPGAVLLALRDNVIGRETMDRAMREYVRRWAFKHPTPADFFRTVENVSGEDLSWFWHAFWYTTGVLDIGIDRVDMRTVDGQRVADIVLTKHTSVPFPVTLRVKYADGSTQDFRFPVQVWNLGDHYTATVPARGDVVGVHLWPDPDVPDWNPANDVWGDAPAVDAGMPSTGGGLASPIGSRP
ncbi:MAG: M1 family metallopeptidase [Gemmatimonadaceae bacterium]